MYDAAASPVNTDAFLLQHLLLLQSLITQLCPKPLCHQRSHIVRIQPAWKNCTMNGCREEYKDLRMIAIAIDST